MPHAIKDLAVIGLSVFVAYLLAKTDALHAVLLGSGERMILGSFISGLFFTSVFTTPVAIVALGEIALRESPIVVAGVGALGALIGDLFLFSVFDGHISRDADALMKTFSLGKMRSLIRSRIFRWLTPLLGALVIASPLPDEIGLAMMGLTHTRISVLVPISYAMNFIGISIIAAAVRAF